jgi:mono/diheme cytochrome c family protein
MKPKILRISLLAGAVVGASAGAWAQSETDVGKREYDSNCAVCHATDGKGQGPYREFLDVAPSDLTVLTKNNQGVFPINRVYEVIDGREAIKAHGPREMPIWARNTASRQPNLHRRPSIRSYVRNRILALIDYLYRIQQK